ncbi:hypothetical protein HispidOSU_015783, partial [Sigmodon hispidus]
MPVQICVIALKVEQYQSVGQGLVEEGASMITQLQLLHMKEGAGALKVGQAPVLRGSAEPGAGATRCVEC